MATQWTRLGCQLVVVGIQAAAGKHFTILKFNFASNVITMQMSKLVISSTFNKYLVFFLEINNLIILNCNLIYLI